MTVEAVVTRVGRGDWPLIRDLRLRALQTDPSSFHATYEGEAAYSEQRWRDWAAEDAAGNEYATFIARQGEQPVGMVAAYRDETHRSLFHIVAMWVAPEVRRAGIGRLLLREIEAWIRSCGGTAAQLSVTSAASAARHLYESAGYAPDGGQAESSHTPGLVEVSLRKELADPSSLADSAG
jgi:ribosomal protein S18 acetylase RimI-like enzyme